MTIESGGDEMGVLNNGMMEGLSTLGAELRTAVINATYLKTHHAASSFEVGQWDLRLLLGRERGQDVHEFALHHDSNGRPFSSLINAGHVNDYTGAAASLDDLHKTIHPMTSGCSPTGRMTLSGSEMR